MPTQRYRWPEYAEAERREAQECAEEAARLIENANRHLASALDVVRTNPGLAEAKMTKAQALHYQALALQERIQRLMIQAQLGRPNGKVPSVPKPSHSSVSGISDHEPSALS
ncbi:MAG: hypothetical protein HGA45_38070 [Chloroflexales bacterium]|nr:hypothetical protein [Chloroflexales bacterium]